MLSHHYNQITQDLEPNIRSCSWMNLLYSTTKSGNYLTKTNSHKPRQTLNNYLNKDPSPSSHQLYHPQILHHTCKSQNEDDFYANFGTKTIPATKRLSATTNEACCNFLTNSDFYHSFDQMFPNQHHQFKLSNQLHSNKQKTQQDSMQFRTVQTTSCKAYETFLQQKRRLSVAS